MMPYSLFFWAFLSSQVVAIPTAESTHFICDAVKSKLPNRVAELGSNVYNASQSSFYSAQERELTPTCVFRPENAVEVAQLMNLVQSSKGNIAVRGGGHMLWTGAANVNGGLTVDMRGLKSFSLSEDRKTVSIGAGTVFSELYPKLTPYNLAVSGARVPGVGAGGYLTGGGVGIYSRSHGWSCDHVRGYEVVLADGRIVYASASTNSDLWLALKGGSNNFGIVTRFDLETIPQGKLWGGELLYEYTPSGVDIQARAFSSFMSPKNLDTAATMAIVLVFQNPGQVYSIADAVFYTKPVVNPPAFQPFFTTPNLLLNITGTNNLADLVTSFGETLPDSVQRSFQLVFSFHNGDADLYKSLISIWENGTRNLAAIEGLGIQFLIQPHPISNGTNSLGLDPKTRDLVMATVTAVYPNAVDEASVNEEIVEVVNAQKRALREKGVYIHFEYLNYADSSQDPFANYGAKTMKQLQGVSRKYDSKGIFQERLAGAFKVF